jgi:hypothetical protein
MHPKKKPKRAGEDDDDEEDCVPTVPTNVEMIRGVQSLLKKLASDGKLAGAVTTANDVLDAVTLNLEKAPSSEDLEAVSIAHVLGHAGQKCQVCGVNLGSAADASQTPELRSDIASRLREGKLPSDWPGLLRHFLTTTGRRLQQDQSDSATLAPIRSML